MSSDSSAKAFSKVCSESARASAEYSMLQNNDKVLATLSGGADSFVMLETLLELKKRAPFDFILEAVSFDPCFPELDIQKIARYCQDRGVVHHTVVLDVPSLLASSPQKRFRRPCVWCSRMRRGKLYGKAQDLKANKLALGHHADDLLESFLISLVRGQGLTTMAPNVQADNGELRIIRPLALVQETLVKQAAGYFNFPLAGECPFKEDLERSGDRAWAKEQIKLWNKRIPNLHKLMLKSLGKAELDWLLDKRYISYFNTDK